MRRRVASVVVGALAMWGAGFTTAVAVMIR